MRSRSSRPARRVLVDLGQVLGSWFDDSIVVIGGWVPDLLIPESDEAHVGSIDVDLALNVHKLREGRYAALVKSLLNTGGRLQRRQRLDERPETTCTPCRTWHESRP